MEPKRNFEYDRRGPRLLLGTTPRARARARSEDAKGAFDPREALHPEDQNPDEVIRVFPNSKVGRSLVILTSSMNDDIAVIVPATYCGVCLAGGMGRAYRVVLSHGRQTIYYRCPECGRVWATTGPIPPDPIGTRRPKPTNPPEL
jgi:hypothetical protein